MKGWLGILVLVFLLVVTFGFNRNALGAEDLKKDWRDSVMRGAANFEKYSKCWKEKVNVNRVDLFVASLVYQMQAISIIFNRGKTCMVLISYSKDPRLYNDLEEAIVRVDFNIARTIKNICAYHFLDKLLPSLGTGAVNLSDAVSIVFDRGVIVRMGINSDVIINVLPADLSLYLKSFEDPYEACLINEYIVVISIPNGGRIVYRANIYGVSQITEFSGIVDIRRNFASVANISFNELLSYLTMYVKERQDTQKENKNSKTLLVNLMTSITEQEKFVEWVTSKFSTKTQVNLDKKNPRRIKK